MGNHGLDLFGTTTFGIIFRDEVLLAAESRVTELNGGVVMDEWIKLEWITDSIFVASAGFVKCIRKIIKKVRDLCEDTPVTSIEEVVELLVKESNAESSTIPKDPSLDAKPIEWSFTVGGKLQSEKKCKLFLVLQNIEQQLYFSRRGKVFYIGGPGKAFFTKAVRDKVEQAFIEYDRALLSEIVKAYIAESCENSKSSGGRVNILTIDARGFHLFESADLINPEAPSKGYKESEFDEFYPVGYRTG